MDGGVLRLVLNDSGRRNALSEEMLAALRGVLTESAVEPAVRVLVIAAQGPAFCAGHDLKQLNAARQADDKGRAYYEKIMTACSAMMQAIVRHPRPVIAEVAGVATAAGCQLVASCDLAVAGASARFATPGINIGLFCSTPMVALSRNVSRKNAMEMLLLGDLVGAEKAHSIGLVNRVVADADLTDATMGLAAEIAAKSAMTLKIGKRAFYEQLEMGLEDAYRFTTDVMVENMLTRDSEEGIAAFVEKRAPDWHEG